MTLFKFQMVERKEMAKAPFNLSNYKKELDINDVHGEEGYSTMERNSIRPTLDVNGIWEDILERVLRLLYRQRHMQKSQ